jgi:hypothetical protein
MAKGDDTKADPEKSVVRRAALAGLATAAAVALLGAAAFSGGARGQEPPATLPPPGSIYSQCHNPLRSETVVFFGHNATLLRQNDDFQRARNDMRISDLVDAFRPVMGYVLVIGHQETVERPGTALDRAREVGAELARRGVPERQIYLRDAGSNEHVYPTVNGLPEEGALQNRRVDIRIIALTAACAFPIMDQRLRWLRENCVGDGAGRADPKRCDDVFNNFFR